MGYICPECSPCSSIPVSGDLPGGIYVPKAVGAHVEEKWQLWHPAEALRGVTPWVVWCRGEEWAAPTRSGQ